VMIRSLQRPIGRSQWTRQGDLRAGRMSCQRGFAALMLMLLVLLLLTIPAMYLAHELSERQRALDRRIKMMLGAPPVPLTTPRPGGAR
jgi:hypothetical protein